MALSYIGGKSKISTWLRNFIPHDIETYVEPFAGMMWLFFKMELKNYPNLKTIVYNDVNPLNVNLFLCLKDYNKLYEVTSNKPIEDVDLFNQCKADIFAEDLVLDPKVPNFDIAFKYAYVLSQLWSGKDPKRGKLVKKGGRVAKDDIYYSKFETFRKKLIDEKWQTYFDKISAIENLDYKDIISKYDSEKTYFYCDPPYYKTEKYYANHEFGESSHLELSNTLKNIKGKFSLSYYDFPQLSEWFPKEKYIWREKEFTKFAMAQPGQAQTKGLEILIMNYGRN